jgi:hypothetical protein
MSEEEAGDFLMRASDALQSASEEETWEEEKTAAQWMAQSANELAS